jgi:hypothetical protein
MSFRSDVKGTEDGIIALLTYLYKRRDDNPAGYLNEIASYGGELSEKTLKEAISQLTPRFPLMLVSYGDGVDKEVPATSPVLGEPRIWRHDCSFSVICCDDDARGEEERRRGAVGSPGAYQMIDDVRDALAGVSFAKRVVDDVEQIVRRVPNRKPLDGDVLLNLDPLRISGVEFIAQMEGLTAYAQHFDTYFKWTEPDRRAAGTPVEELIFDVTPQGDGSDKSGALPGVLD